MIVLFVNTENTVKFKVLENETKFKNNFALYEKIINTFKPIRHKITDLFLFSTISINEQIAILNFDGNVQFKHVGLKDSKYYDDLILQSKFPSSVLFTIREKLLKIFNRNDFYFDEPVYKYMGDDIIVRLNSRLVSWAPNMEHMADLRDEYCAEYGNEYADEYIADIKSDHSYWEPDYEDMDSLNDMLLKVFNSDEFTLQSGEKEYLAVIIHINKLTD